MSKKYLITGGTGFIGSNYVYRLLARGEHVTIYDNLSRAGASKNLAWLNESFGENDNRLIIGDVADSDWCPGDQKVTYADIRKVERELGWKPRIGV